MPRSQSITQVRFDGTPLPLVLSLRLGRSAAPKPLAGDDGPFATSVQLGQAVVTAELHTRDVAAAESLSLGTQGELVFTTGTMQDDQHARQVTLKQAVLYSVELQYEQSTPASAVLRFMAESSAPSEDPFAAEEEA